MTPGRLCIGMCALIGSAAAATGSGCASMIVHNARKDPGPHDTLLNTIVIGVIGDGLLALGGSGIHAAADDQRTVGDVLPFYALGVVAADVLGLIILRDGSK
jgi:hypothetical protein